MTENKNTFAATQQSVTYLCSEMERNFPYTRCKLDEVAVQR